MEVTHITFALIPLVRTRDRPIPRGTRMMETAFLAGQLFPNNKPIQCKGEDRILWTPSCLDYTILIDLHKTQRSHIKVTYYLITAFEVYDDACIKIKCFRLILFNSSAFSLAWSANFSVLMLFLRSLEYEQEYRLLYSLCVKNWDFLSLCLRLDKICSIDTGFDK